MGVPNKVMSLLGIAMKSKNLVSGEFQTLEAVRSKKACLVIISTDATDNTRKLFNDKCAFYEIPVVEYGLKEDLGRAIGKDLRSSLAVCDAGLAAAIKKQLEMEK
ncbi:MAG: ribosomal L7Ae/L30e/S12e/Gadd45 family protein [Lachnospiraceae bacterium]|nr:ribosomal L7Ae/L30e/S12e/Gadd45 family protein [Lachnospiraceae bacterium]MBR3507523.1 ribosomal L7Ae/L30e/S12e/Gadd45 family protein [Lachnospiraceae bacterium]MBR4608502.1 ribosomal L7Ae/L30e/S12e/Gadd45 family protein [Lachnospiraceae bacterium]MBR6152751.1 ribosomal L7Ae/L30e/S12e/Gadd45 family protein [Lachnospiraceae bacterium]